MRSTLFSTRTNPTTSGYIKRASDGNRITAPDFHVRWFSSEPRIGRRRPPRKQRARLFLDSFGHVSGGVLDQWSLSFARSRGRAFGRPLAARWLRTLGSHAVYGLDSKHRGLHFPLRPLAHLVHGVDLPSHLLRLLLEPLVLERLGASDTLLGVDCEHLPDEVLGCRRDGIPVGSEELVLPALDLLVELSIVLGVEGREAA
mmetsp:Transcript_48878/g.104341  ORF Transcript_48878/g.104341 Transcript_48878/m.104341 type:complete len:201 (+) Transcript_48878:448-1050(+)